MNSTSQENQKKPKTNKQQQKKESSQLSRTRIAFVIYYLTSLVSLVYEQVKQYLYVQNINIIKEKAAQRAYQRTLEQNWGNKKRKKQQNDNILQKLEITRDHLLRMKLFQIINKTVSSLKKPTAEELRNTRKRVTKKQIKEKKSKKNQLRETIEQNNLNYQQDLDNGNYQKEIVNEQQNRSITFFKDFGEGNSSIIHIDQNQQNQYVQYMQESLEKIYPEVNDYVGQQNLLDKIYLYENNIDKQIKIKKTLKIKPKNLNNHFHHLKQSKNANQLQQQPVCRNLSSWILLIILSMIAILVMTAIILPKNQIESHYQQVINLYHYNAKSPMPKLYQYEQPISVQLYNIYLNQVNLNRQNIVYKIQEFKNKYKVLLSISKSLL